MKSKTRNSNRRRQPKSESVVPVTTGRKATSKVTQSGPVGTCDRGSLIFLGFLLVAMTLSIFLIVKIEDLENADDIENNVLEENLRTLLKIQSEQLEFNNSISEVLRQYAGNETNLRNSLEDITRMVSYHHASSTVPSKTTNYVRLVNGASGDVNSGRVELYHDGVWGTICDDYWDDDDAKVICRMLEYNGSSEAHRSAYYGEGNGKIWLDDVTCTGDEVDIAYCEHAGWGVTDDCIHLEDASVTCY